MLARSADVEMSMLHDMHARGRLCRSCFTFSSWSHVLKAKSVLPAGYTRRTGPGGVFNTRLIMRKPVIGRSSPVRPGPATATGRIHHHAVPCFLQTRRPPARPRGRAAAFIKSGDRPRAAAGTCWYLGRALYTGTFWGWRFSVAVTRWSQSTQLLYTEPG